jgi:cathepsin L
MKFLLLSVLLVLAVSSASSAGLRSRYNNWRARFGKKNDDKATEEARIAAFEKNINLIDEHNEQYLNGNSPFFVDLNEHSALLDSEKKNLKGLIRVEAINGRSRRGIGTSGMRYRAGGVIFYPYHKNASAKVFAARDWRTVWQKPIENQGTCGSCWSFSAANVIDAAYKIRKNQTISTSKQEFLDCSSYLGNGGCNGGSQGLAFEYAQTKGIGAESKYPAYKNAVGTCTKAASPNYKIDGFVQVDKDEEALRQAVDELGVCTVSIDVDSDPLFMTYKGGIYNGNGKCKNGTTDVDHAVVLVGYGTENGVPFWIIRNSWGTTWGEQGYIRLRRNANNLCGITNFAYCVVLK